VWRPDYRGRITDTFTYAKEIEAASLRRVLSEATPEDESDTDCLFVEEDPDEWWRGLEAVKQKQDEEERSKGQKAKLPVLTPVEATEALRIFLAERESDDRLRNILEQRANPNIPGSRGTPMDAVLCYAPRKKVDAMRTLLLEHGAKETESHKRMWKNVRPRKDVMTPCEATHELLNTFRPLREKIEELKSLLDMNADPNAPIPAGRISALSNVTTFAPRETVSQMRQLLFEYGAEETAEDKDDWLRRQKADACEDDCTSAFYEDDRHLCPVAAAMEK